MTRRSKATTGVFVDRDRWGNDYILVQRDGIARPDTWLYVAWERET